MHPCPPVQAKRKLKEVEILVSKSKRQNGGKRMAYNAKGKSIKELMLAIATGQALQADVIVELTARTQREGKGEGYIARNKRAIAALNAGTVDPEGVVKVAFTDPNKVAEATPAKATPAPSANALSKLTKSQLIEMLVLKIS
tara:strand:- start:82 stop:507 length:426 start_codon:yes stop_codon:yes gene_type:complete